MRKIVFKLMFVISFLQVKAQSDFRAGYVINKEKDTIFGWIDYKGDLANSKKCFFKTKIDSEVQVLTPETINAYRFIDSKYYISKEIKDNKKTDLVFLEYLINGVIDMYYYRDDNLKNHYYVETKERLYELKNDEKEMMEKNRTYLKESKEYIGALKYVFKESSTLVKKVENIDLKHQSLIDITLDYHKEFCPEETCTVYEKKAPKIIKTSGLIVGVNAFYTSVGNLSKTHSYFTGSEFDVTFSPLIGRYYKMSIPNFSERIFFQYDLTYSFYKQKTSNLFTEGEFHVNDYHHINFTRHALFNDFVMKYESSNKKNNPTFFAGFFAGIVVTSKYNRDLESIYPSGLVVSSHEDSRSPFTRLDYGVSLGAGLKRITFKKKELFLELKYKRGFGLLEGFNQNYLGLNLNIQI